MDGDVVNYNLSGFFSDLDDGDSLVYSVDHIPGGLKFDPTTGTFTGQFANWASDHTNTGVKGEYLITVTATDKSGASVSQTFVWTVGNPVPVATNDEAPPVKTTSWSLTTSPKACWATTAIRTATPSAFRKSMAPTRTSARLSSAPTAARSR